MFTLLFPPNVKLFITLVNSFTIPNYSAPCRQVEFNSCKCNFSPQQTQDSQYDAISHINFTDGDSVVYLTQDNAEDRITHLRLSNTSADPSRLNVNHGAVRGISVVNVGEKICVAVSDVYVNRLFF